MLVLTASNSPIGLVFLGSYLIQLGKEGLPGAGTVLLVERSLQVEQLPIQLCLSPVQPRYHFVA